MTVIGSGDAFNSRGALHSCYLVEQGGRTLMLECGPGVLVGMKRLDIDTNCVDAVAISHLHGDHFGGLPFLFLEYTFQNPRDRPLTLIGPATMKERVFRLYNTLYQGMSQCSETPFELEFIEMEPGGTFDVHGFSGSAFEVPHNADPLSLGYRIESGDRTLLFSGDSGWTEEFIEQSRDVDLFLCECCMMEPVLDLHLSYRQLLEHGQQLGCKRLLLTHLGEDVRDATEFELERAHDGMVVDI